MIRVGLRGRAGRWPSSKIHIFCRQHSIGAGDHDHSHGGAQIILDQHNKDAVRITKIGLASNVALVISKGVGGVVFHSSSLLADAWHSVGDLVADFLTLATVQTSWRPPTERFPFGLGRVETIGTVAVSGLLLIAGMGVGISSAAHIAEELREHVFVDPGIGRTITGSLITIGSGHSHSHAVVDVSAAWLAGASIIVKELLFRKTLEVGKKTNSAVLVANVSCNCT